MSKIHTEQQLAHGHLTCHNILFDDYFNIKISDFGFSSLKRLSGLQFGYINKTFYTAPEHLSDKENVTKNVTFSSDVYSYGFILWVLFNEKEPFKGATVKELI